MSFRGFSIFSIFHSKSIGVSPQFYRKPSVCGEN
jgi:hypothetical protein